jgi:hypothetical protein
VESAEIGAFEVGNFALFCCPGVDARVDVAALPADVVLGVGRRGALELVVRGLACGASSGGAAGFLGADAARSPRARVRAASAACAAALASAARCSRDGRGTGTSTSEPLTVGLSERPSRPRSLGGASRRRRGGGGGIRRRRRRGRVGDGPGELRVEARHLRRKRPVERTGPAKLQTSLSRSRRSRFG